MQISEKARKHKYISYLVGVDSLHTLVLGEDKGSSRVGCSWQDITGAHWEAGPVHFGSTLE